MTSVPEPNPLLAKVKKHRQENIALCKRMSELETTHAHMSTKHKLAFSLLELKFSEALAHSIFLSSQSTPESCPSTFKPKRPRRKKSSCPLYISLQPSQTTPIKVKPTWTSKENLTFWKDVP